jgi:glutamine synthetase
VFTTVHEAIEFIARENIELVDLKITTLAGGLLHVTLPAARVGEHHFQRGVGYDGSSGSGFARVEAGDVAARPDPATAFIDPFAERPTLSFLCDTVDAVTREPSPMDPRTIARKAEARLAETGIADRALFAPEFEFHVFDTVRVINDTYTTAVDIEAPETHTNGENHAIRSQLGYMHAPPADALWGLRNEIMLTLEQVGVVVKYHHHEVGASGQCEVEVGMQTLVRAADQAQLVKYVVKNAAARRGMVATFMPKPLFGEAGNGMHVHQKLERDGEHLFFDTSGRNYADLSDLAIRYTAGLLQHGRALTGLTNPSTNSYKRLVEGYEAPVHLFFSLGNRSAAVRVPRYASSPEQKRIEYRPPDFTGNVYLTLASMLLAGLDGIERDTDPSDHNLGPFDVDMAAQTDEFKSGLASVPNSLERALDALCDDSAFLTCADVFTEGFLDAWRRLKVLGEARQINQRPHPYEYALYLDT